MRNLRDDQNPLRNLTAEEKTELAAMGDDSTHMGIEWEDYDIKAIDHMLRVGACSLSPEQLGEACHLPTHMMQTACLLDLQALRPLALMQCCIVRGLLCPCGVLGGQRTDPLFCSCLVVHSLP